VTRYESRDGRVRLFHADSRRLTAIPTASVGVILTSPPYWIEGRGRASAERYAHELAVGFGREWRRVLAPDGDLWLVIGDRHDGAEWVGMDGLVTGWLRRTGWRLQSRGFWAQTRSRERWDNRVNYLLRFRKAGAAPVRPRGTTLCWMLPLPRSHPDSLWDAIPDPVVRAILEASSKRGPVLDPFAGAGTVGRVAVALGREWIGVERDPHMAQVTARRFRLRRVTSSPAAAPARPRSLTRARPAAPGRAAGGLPRRRPSPPGSAAGPRS
jgi:DNA modification methylase